MNFDEAPDTVVAMATRQIPGLHNGVDLNSLTATKSVTFTFDEQTELPIVAFRCLLPLGTCLVIKKWLIARFDSGEFAGTDLLRCENLELDTIQPETVGTLLLLEKAAQIHFPFVAKQTDGMDVSIMVSEMMRGFLSTHAMPNE